MYQNTFATLGVSAEVIAALEARGIDDPFQIQTRVVPPALAGTDLLAKSPTGSGKTLAFAIPLVDRTPRRRRPPAALVLVPTRELALQVSEEIEVLARRTRPLGRDRLRWRRPPAPGEPCARRARDRRDAGPVRRTCSTGGSSSLDAVAILVLDEADRMLDMGFKPQVDRIVKRLPRDRQTMFFSATLDGEVGELARAYTQSPAHIEAELPERARRR